MCPMSTDYHAKYYANELTRQKPSGNLDRLSMSLFDATVDLNPHQIDAALFAMQSPLIKGVLLADEVGLGKTIEAGLILCQYWAEKKRRLVVICPASIRKQWSLELEEKFNLPTLILDSKTYKNLQTQGKTRPFEVGRVVIISYQFAGKMQTEMRETQWDLVVIDEAHKLRNVYKQTSKIGQKLRWALENRRKVLLTATPLQNSLLELYGLSTLLDSELFGDVETFRDLYMKDGNLIALRNRINRFCKRTLRNQVLEYIRYTQRHPLTQPFRPNDDEHALYEAVSEFLKRPDTYALPDRQRQLTVLILRKLLASSSRAIAGTLETMKLRLEKMRDGLPPEDDFLEKLVEDEEIEEEILEEAEEEAEEQATDQPGSENAKEQQLIPEKVVDRKKLEDEIKELTHLSQWARSIGIDTKTRSLLKGLELGFGRMSEIGAKKKALIFTESRRTQSYVKEFLEANGYAGRVILFNGDNKDEMATRIYDKWLEVNQENGRATGSKLVDIRTALIEYFRDSADIMIATEAGAEGVNLQFCSLVVNYDLPWNPQRIEQRIGRCHRYGQKHDVVVINFLNERNEADRRVLEILTDKFNLFSGVFGASDDVLGSVESGLDFEKRILSICQECRTNEEIEKAFQLLRQEMDESIKNRVAEAKSAIIQHFDEDVHARLKIQLDGARESLDRVSRMFWSLTKHILNNKADFSDSELTFTLQQSPLEQVKSGFYHLISKEKQNVTGEFLYRLSHPLGSYVLDTGKLLEAPKAHLVFKITGHPTRISQVEALKGKSGWLTLEKLTVDSFEREEYLLFSAVDDKGVNVDQETCEKLFRCEAEIRINETTSSPERLKQEAERHSKATVSISLEANNNLFQQEREKLEQWADDKVAASEKELLDVKAQIKELTRQARKAPTLDEQHKIQDKIQDLENQKKRRRQEIFDVEDEIEQMRDELIESLEKRMAPRTKTETLFTIRWNVV